MDIAKTLRKASLLFDKANAEIPASDLRDAYKVEREFRELVCKFADFSEALRPHIRTILACKVMVVLHLANSEADHYAVTDWLMA